MRIAFVPAARVLSESRPNGEALIASSLIRGLAARGHEILAYCERNELPAIDGVEVREIRVAGASVALARLDWARRIARNAAGASYDVAHVLFPFTTADGYSFVDGAPLVCGPVNLPWPADASRPTGFARRALHALTKGRERRAHARTLGRAARIMTTGAASRAGLNGSIHDRCVDVPFGVDTDRFLARPLPHEPTILFLSVLQERKGVEVLLRAMPEVVRCMPRARLVIAGEDPHGMRAGLERLAVELGVASDVTFLGDVSPDEAPSVYERATVVCQPSLGEPFGMTVIEAMAAGRAVVGTAAGGIPDAVVEGEGGRLVPAGDERLLADALCAVLTTPGLAERMGAFNRARVLERYALDRVLDRIEAVHRDAVRSREVAGVS